jgi:A/G-specific adenine glycosylase
LRTPRARAPHHPVAVLLLRDPRGRVLLQQRAPDRLLGGLWELPGGKIHVGEGREHAVRRELREELGIRRVRGLRYVGGVDHAYSHFSVTLHLFVGETSESPRVLRGPVAARWVEPRRISGYTLPRGTHKVLQLWIRRGRPGFAPSSRYAVPRGGAPPVPRAIRARQIRVERPPRRA